MTQIEALQEAVRDLRARLAETEATLELFRAGCAALAEAGIRLEARVAALESAPVRRLILPQ